MSQNFDVSKELWYYYGGFNMPIQSAKEAKKCMEKRGNELGIDLTKCKIIITERYVQAIPQKETAYEK